MIDSILYVFDQTHKAERLIQYCRQKKINKIFLCPITTNQGAISLLFKSLSSLDNSSVEILPYLKYFNEIAFSERDSFIRFVSKLGSEKIFGGKSLNEYFEYPNSSFSTWWLSSIVEKNTIKSASYHNLVKLLTILKFKNECNPQRIIFDINLPELSYALGDNKKKEGYDFEDFKVYRRSAKIITLFKHLLKGAKSYFYLIYKIFVVKINTKDLQFRKEILENARYVAITYFPLLDKNLLKQKKFVNKFYGSLQAALEKKYKGRFIWFAITGSIDSFKNNVKLCKQINTWNYPIYFIEEQITLKDLIFIIAQWVHTITKFVILLPYISRSLSYSNSKMNIWSIFEEEWFSSFAGNILMSGIIYFWVFKNISAELKDGTVTTYLAENKAWEKVLNFVFHDQKELKTVGILHTTVPLLCLQFFDCKDDLQQDSKAKLAMPKPDYLACNGRVSLGLLRRSGWDEKRAFLWFAVRYQYLKERIGRNISWADRQDKILLTLPVNHQEVKEILFYIHQAFNDKANYQIVIKEHYLLPVRPFIKRINLDFDRDTFIFSEEELSRILSQVKAMVVTSSSAALESIALGCPVIIPKLSSVVDMNPLLAISDLPIFTESPEELKSVVDNIIGRKEAPISYDRCRNLIEDYFNFFDSEDELIEKIDSCFVNNSKIL